MVDMFLLHNSSSSVHIIRVPQFHDVRTWESRRPTRPFPVTPGNRGDDRERVGRSHRRGFLCRQIAHILVVQVQVNKGAQLSLPGEQVLLQFGMVAREPAEGVGNRGRIHVHAVAPAYISTQGSWYEDDHVRNDCPCRQTVKDPGTSLMIGGAGSNQELRPAK